MVSKARPNALPGLVTKNYFSVLATIEVEIQEVDGVDNPKHVPRFQIIL